MITIYDLNIDEFREVTQADVDRLTRIEQAFGVWRLVTNRLMSEVLSLAKGDDEPKPLLDGIGIGEQH